MKLKLLSLNNYIFYESLFSIFLVELEKKIDSKDK